MSNVDQGIRPNSIPLMSDPIGMLTNVCLPWISVTPTDLKRSLTAEGGRYPWSVTDECPEDEGPKQEEKRKINREKDITNERPY